MYQNNGHVKLDKDQFAFLNASALTSAFFQQKCDEEKNKKNSDS